MYQHTTSNADHRQGSKLRHIPIPYAALDLAASHKHRAALTYMYELGHQRWWRPTRRTLRDLERMWGLSRRTLTRFLDRLQEAGLLVWSVISSLGRKEGIELHIFDPMCVPQRVPHQLPVLPDDKVEEQAGKSNRSDLGVPHGVPHGMPHLSRIDPLEPTPAPDPAGAKRSEEDSDPSPVPPPSPQPHRPHTQSSARPQHSDPQPTSAQGSISEATHTTQTECVCVEKVDELVGLWVNAAAPAAGLRDVKAPRGALLEQFEAAVLEDPEDLRDALLYVAHGRTSHIQYLRRKRNIHLSTVLKHAQGWAERWRASGGSRDTVSPPRGSASRPTPERPPRATPRQLPGGGLSDLDAWFERRRASEVIDAE